MSFYIVRDTLRSYKAEPGVTEAVIPEGVKRISGSAFAGRKHLTSVIIPDGVEFIGCSAFVGCSELRYIRFPATLTEIEFDAFAGTPWLAAQEEFVIIGSVLYQYRGKDAVVHVPEGVKHIAQQAFHRNEEITLVHLPDGLLTIGNSAFFACHSLCSVNIPDTVQYIGSDVFWNCSSIQTLSVPPSVKEIGFYAFRNTSWMEKKTEEFTILGDGILYCCRSQRKKVVLPQEVKRIAPFAFYSSSSMKNLVTQTADGNIFIYVDYRDFSEDEWHLMMQIVHEADIEKQMTLFKEMKKACFKIPLALHMTRVHERPFFHFYLKRMIKKAMEIYICNNNEESIKQILELGLVTVKNIDAFIGQAIAAGALESQMLLMHYKHETLGYKKPENAFRL